MTSNQSPLTPQEIDGFRQRLNAQRDELIEQLAELQRNAAAPGDDEETLDDGSLLEAREEALGTAAFLRDELEHVQHALTRIDEGTYGQSEISGKPIPRERLDALPTATTLVDE